MLATCIDPKLRLGLGLSAVLTIALFGSTAWAQGGDPPAEKPAASDAAPPATPPAAGTPAAADGESTGNPAAGQGTGSGMDLPKPPLQPIGSLSGTDEEGGAVDAGAGAGAGTGVDPGAGTGTAGTPAALPPGPDTSEMPVNLRLRRLEQRVQALKERAWRAKARVGMLKEAVLGGGVGATATVVHKNKMGSSFRLIRLVYALDGSQVFARSDDTGALHKQKNFEVLTGPIAPGSHTISVLAIYRGHGYGVFKYLTKYKFTVRSSHTFTATEGKNTRIEAVGFEKGGVTTPLEDRPALDFKVSHARGAGES